MRLLNLAFSRFLAASTLLALAGLAIAAGAPRAAASASASASTVSPPLPGFSDKFVQVNGIRLHYRVGGWGKPVVLLHGYAQTGHMWGPAMQALARTRTVIVPDLRGAGRSDRPQGGYDKVTMAKDIHELVRQISTQPAALVGHDIGMMVAYAYAAQFPDDTEKVVLMDAFLPGIGDWRNAFPAQAVWHFHFYGDTPLALVKGRERIYFEHFWNDMSADRNKSVKEADRRIYTAAYAQPGGMRAGFSYFSDFDNDARDFTRLAETSLTMPVLTIAGEKSAGTFLGRQVSLVANNVQSIVIPGAGHWLIDEAPEPVLEALDTFLH